MKIGQVTADGDALVHLVVEGAEGEAHEVEAVLDTGFNGFLALPAGKIQALQLPYRNELQLTLASGEERLVATYVGTVRWNGVARSVAVIEAGEAFLSVFGPFSVSTSGGIRTPTP